MMISMPRPCSATSGSAGRRGRGSRKRVAAPARERCGATEPEPGRYILELLEFGVATYGAGGATYGAGGATYGAGGATHGAGGATYGACVAMYRAGSGSPNLGRVALSRSGTGNRAREYTGRRGGERDRQTKVERREGGTIRRACSPPHIDAARSSRRRT
jgi:hypothetical protein